MKNLLLTIYICCFGMLINYANAQTITGNVKSATGNVDHASINLISTKDSSIIKASLTNDSGVFKIQAPTIGAYKIQVQSLGYKDFYSDSINLKKGSVFNLPEIYLTNTAADLTAVAVSTKKPFIEQKIDKTVVNIANSIVAVGNTVWDVLDKVPGVVVDNGNNRVNLQGKSGVMIYIDGKNTYLSGDQLANLLKSMDASTIQTIEVMTHPSAQYDAAGNAGIINIVTKKNKAKGFNGSLTTGYGQGRFARQNIGGDMNYRNGKLNLYGNYSFYNGKSWNSNYINRDFAESTTTSAVNSPQNAYNVSKWKSHNFKVGADYYLDSTNTIGVMVNGVINPNSEKGNNTTKFLSNNQLDSTAVTNSNSSGKWNSMTYDVNYKHDLDNNGAYIMGDFAYSRFNSKSDQYYETSKYDAENNLLPSIDGLNPLNRIGNLPSLINIKTGKIDFSKPLKNKAKIEAGLKSSYVTSDNDVHYYNQIDNNYVVDSTITNHFKYTENINAAYVNYNQEFEKGWSIQLGLRGEQTVSKGHQYSNDSTVHRNYFKLFPTVFIQKKIKENHTLGFTYNRRIDRPDYQDLNPFLYYLDPYTYSQGNPFLQPQITNSGEVSYAYKTWLVTSLNYTHTSDVISDVLIQDDATKVTYQTKQNVNTTKNITLTTSLNFNVTKWWSTNNSIILMRNYIDGSYLDAPVNLRKNTLIYNGTNTFTLPKGFKAELSGNYHSALIWGLFDIKPQYQINTGIQKNIFNNNATIKVNVNDIFRMQKSNVNINYGNINTYVSNRWDSRRVNISFTWRFKKGKIQTRSHNNTAADDESSRIKSK
ncbi:TonB-dependent receptor [Rhizosphaericola mali]|uniref:TonB-dependent receptor n=1 Tax=Rhizosphaericola mali TaxID=2545455 RepID=A0A5P2G1S7_9BACT|nr:TonB-dependent receptor [Rhizosphaericola mali]QES87800.1 TonB-dependent receptor [Rhizosphaericola mali]